MTDNALQPLLARLAERRNLVHEEAARAFQIIMNGGATPAQMGAFLMGLRLKGETPQEIAAGAEVLRAKALAFNAPDCLDTCGTGGDAHGTVNISTAAAIVLASCGVRVAKHGNRAVSSQCGSADVLAECGVKVEAEPKAMQRCLEELNICFLLATRYHAAMRHVAPVRQELKLRTVFNLLGPLSNPAKPTRQLLGVYDAKWLEPIAQALHALGTKRAWVVHGAEGVDELSLSGASQVAELKDGEVRRFTVTPEEAGLEAAPLSALKGGDAKANARALESLFASEKGAYRNAVLLNAAAGLVIAEKADDLRAGVALAAQAIDDGAAMRTLRLFAEASHARG